MTQPHQWQDEVLAGPGGAMTDEVGVITGPLTLRSTEVAGGLLRFDVQYKDADEWYTLTGSPRPHHGDPAAVHAAALAAIRTGGGAQAPT
ncbi:hypothetical protein [Streptomyces avidinii]|uniref:Tyrosinase co-factor MelC1 n=1 Tax=Streptomyces avidinii TaxID=1895 RepID=A0ABS4KX62_STRAV|nr:hypothetical protein [Streptomyces avidinii]MBP2034622.1 hypothetical protein [Streptomyces avidinii]GGY87632.1 hypothetical protein GCM10010343_10910 [Streptomyces avidinii]